MPPAIAGAAIAGAFSAVVGATAFGLGIAGTAFLVAGANLALGFITRAMAGKPKVPTFPDFKVEAQDRVTTARTTAAGKTMVLGEAQIAGPLNAFESTGTDNEFLHTAVPHAVHPCDAATAKFLNDEEIGDQDGSGNVTTGRFKDHARFNVHLGAFDQAADSDMVDEIPGWTANDKGGGITYSAIRNKQSQDVWPNGFSNAKVTLRGMPCYDPRVAAVAITSSTAADPAVFATTAAHGRSVGDYVWIPAHDAAVPTVEKMYQVKTVPTATTLTLLDEDGATVALTTGGSGGELSPMAWTDNWTLLVHMYMAHRATLNAKDSEFNFTQIAADANKCDEQVSLTPENRTFAAAPADDILTLASNAPWRIGDGCTVATTGTLPAGLAPATTYYLIRDSKTKVRLAATLEDARARIAIDITGAGTDTHTITRQSQLRYTCNGVVILGANPVEALDDLMTAAAGVVVDDEGIFKIYCGVAAASSGTTDETDLRDAELAPEPHLPYAETFNSVRGTYVDPDKFYAPVDAPPYQNSTYVAADGGEEIFRDLALPFTDCPVRAQRLFKIAVERARQGVTVMFRAKPRKFPTAVWDVEAVSIDLLGWAAKEFRVMSVRENPDLGIDLLYREEAAAVWDWNLGDETSLDPAPNSGLPDPFTVANPTGLVVSTETVIDEQGGKVHRAVITWTAPADANVTKGGAIEVRFKKSADANYDPTFEVSGDKTKATTPALDLSVDYDFGARSRNNIGIRIVPETWTTVTGFTVGAASVGATARVDYGLIVNAADVFVRDGGIGETASRTIDDGTIV